ncbi:MAG: division/cell wall cluster transcriptional repressor MraZ [Bacteroidetes bacterium]|nr:division/cell wall cluster transcriptional repressor MraZ [Bacteroidota bacterium]
MVGFLGQSEHSIDDKGRVALPARMRRELSPDADETFIAWQGIEQCVTLIPKNVWKEKADLLTKLSPFLKDNRIVKRTESRRAERVILDAQGRISLPRTHIDHAGLDGEKVVIIGTIDTIEIWDPAILKAEDDAQADSYESLVERVMSKFESE